MCTVRGISNALRAKVRKFSRRHRITRARSHITILKNRIQFHISRVRTHTHAHLPLFLPICILILGYSILLINLLFLFYLNPFQMSLSSVCIDRIDAKLYQRLSKIVSNKTSRKFPKICEQHFTYFQLPPNIYNTHVYATLHGLV